MDRHSKLNQIRSMITALSRHFNTTERDIQTECCIPLQSSMVAQEQWWDGIQTCLFIAPYHVYITDYLNTHFNSNTSATRTFSMLSTNDDDFTIIKDVLSQDYPDVSITTVSASIYRMVAVSAKNLSETWDSIQRQCKEKQIELKIQDH
jgi:hypothetical protein